jgi:hypothetical protein
MKDLYNNIMPVQLVAPVDKAHTAWWSNYIDLAGFEGCVIDVNVGAVTGGISTSYLLLQLMEADLAPTVPASTASYSAVAAADMQGSFAIVYNGHNDGTLQRVGYKGAQRYICVYGSYVDAGSNVSADIVGVVAIVGIAAERPTNAAPTTGSVS